MWDERYGLYPYQDRAAKAMLNSDVLLAFEMGTGKTPTTLWALEELRGLELFGPGTVVVPSSLKWQWQREVERFTDQKAVVIDGTLKQRQAQYLTVRGPGNGYMIMSYTTFVSDWKHHNHLARAFLVLDEATAIKNYKSKRSMHIKNYRNHYRIKFALTGTPIENGQAEEIFSIMEFVDPRILGKYWAFDHKYVRRNSMGWIEGYRNLDQFHRIIKPYTLRATHKEQEVAKFLPKVMYRDPVMVKMGRRTSKALGWIEDQLLSDLDSIVPSFKDFDWENPSPDHPDGRMMAKIQVMRMLIDHPSAVKWSAARHDDPQSLLGSAFASEFIHTFDMEQFGTPKLDALEKYVKDFLDLDFRNKAVIFCSFVHVADRICQRFPDISTIFTGGMSSKQKDASKQSFASDPQCRLFVSTDAGGYGLDLPEANLLINYDLPWQAGLLKQRNARIRRASSTWPYVIVQDFIGEGTIEERMRQMLDHKIAVGDAIVDGEGITDAGTIVSDLDSLSSFLRNDAPTALIHAS